jgi:hypothetical protein
MADAKETPAKFVKKKPECVPMQLLLKRPLSGPLVHASAQKRNRLNEPSLCIGNKGTSSVNSKVSSSVSQGGQTTELNVDSSEPCNKTAVTKRKKCKAKRRSQLLQHSKDAQALALTVRTEEDMEIEYSVVINEVCA